MSSQSRLFFGGAFAVVAFDTVASIVSRVLQLSYGDFSIVSFAIYLAIGVIASRICIENAAMAALTAGATTGLVDATAGWSISALIGPGIPKHPSTPLGVGMVIFFVSVSAGLIAAAGYFLESRLLYRFWRRA